MGAATVVSTLSLMGTSSFVVDSLQTKRKFPPSCYKDGRAQPRPTSLARNFCAYTDVVILYIVVSLVDRWHEAASRTVTAVGVRRDKAALSSGCKSHPAKRSSRKQPEQLWR